MEKSVPLCQKSMDTRWTKCFCFLLPSWLPPGSFQLFLPNHRSFADFPVYTLQLPDSVDGEVSGQHIRPWAEKMLWRKHTESCALATYVLRHVWCMFVHDHFNISECKSWKLMRYWDMGHCLEMGLRGQSFACYTQIAVTACFSFCCAKLLVCSVAYMHVSYSPTQWKLPGLSFLSSKFM